MSQRFKKKKISDYVEVTVYVPKSLHDILKKASEQYRLPISKLMNIAVDNELDSSNPFNYPCELPTNEFIPFAYTEEANKILNFLYRFPGGLSKDSLLLMRRDIGIAKREDVLAGYRELLKSNLIEEFISQTTKFDYRNDYVFARAVDIKYNSRAITKRRNIYKEIIRKG